MMEKKTRQKNTNLAGFSLVEMLIAMTVFFLLSVMVIGSYFEVFQARTRTRYIQQNVEDARYAMELMAKSLRMSSVFSENGEGDSIIAYDYSQGKCLHYRLHGKSLEVGEGTADARVNSDGKGWVGGCQSFDNYKPMTVGDIDDLSFNIVASDFNSDSLGHVTIGLTVCYQDNCDLDSASIQTSVSLHDYSYIKDGRN